MAGLQRSVTSFRRQGSSGLIWDDKLISGELKQAKQQNEEAADKKEKVELREPRPCQGEGSNKKIERSRSNGGRHGGYRTRKVSSPPIDPPSPKVSGCGICGIFGKPLKSHQTKYAKRT